MVSGNAQCWLHTEGMLWDTLGYSGILGDTLEFWN